MSTQQTQKQQLMENIRHWIKLDTDIKAMQRQVKQMQTSKKQITDVIVQEMQRHDMDEIKATHSGGSLVRKQRKQKSGITAKYLKTQLTAYFETAEQVGELIQKINAGRKVSVIDEIKFVAAS